VFTTNFVRFFQKLAELEGSSSVGIRFSLNPF